MLLCLFATKIEGDSTGDILLQIDLRISEFLKFCGPICGECVLLALNAIARNDGLSSRKFIVRNKDTGQRFLSKDEIEEEEENLILPRKKRDLKHRQQNAAELILLGPRLALIEVC